MFGSGRSIRVRACFKLDRLSLHGVTHLIHEYGLIVVFLAAGLQAIGFPVPGGTALVAAGIDASTKHGLPVAGVICAGAFGALAGTTTGFALGRWRGNRLLLRVGRLLGQSPERVQQLRGWFQHHAVAPLFIARFITGARNVAGLLAGASGMPLRRFLAVSAAAAIAWSALITLEYYFVGRAILGAPTWLQVGVLILGLIGTIVSLRLLNPRMSGSAAAPGHAADPAD